MALPLGDITSSQLRVIADIGRRYVRETVRTIVERKLVLRWVSEMDLPQLYGELNALGLAETGASIIADVKSCPVLAPTHASSVSPPRVVWPENCAGASAR